MEIILLEKIEKLGTIGDVVNVKNGFARNFLLPRNKALRATAENRKHIEAEKAKYEAQYKEQVSAAQKDIKSLENATVTIIRQASDDGRLYGSISAKEIAVELSTLSGMKVSGSAVMLKTKLREIGLHDIEVVLHPEVKTTIMVNIARSEEEAAVALTVPATPEPEAALETAPETEEASA